MRKNLLLCFLVCLPVLCLAAKPTIKSLGTGDVNAMKVSMLLDGSIHDQGFMEAGFSGLTKIHDELKATAHYIDGVRPEHDQIKAALVALAKENPDLIIAHGGQNAETTKEVAKDYPNIEFVVTQGSVTGDNLSSYEVLQEQSAFLAGAAAAMLTQTGVVGHMSGIRVKPGLKGRAAFADGIRYVNPDVKLLTSFIGDQDDTELANRYAKAQLNAGADIIFTMLNAGRSGASEAIGKHPKAYEIGNVIDYVQVNPKVFIASAVANSGLGGFLAAKEMKNGDYKPEVKKVIGLEEPEVVRLSLSNKVPQEVKDRIAELASKIKSGEIEINLNYSGEEFSL